MINHLKGRILERGRDHLVLECLGIGFRVSVTAATLERLPNDPQSDVTILTHLHFRDGGADLFGFCSPDEREIFHALNAVSGVGPKSAMAVISTLGAEGVVSGVLRGDAKAFASVSGIGKKLAHRIASELPDRIRKFPPGISSSNGNGGYDAVSDSAGEAVDALVSLGFQRSDVVAALSRIRPESGDGGGTEALIRLGLAQLSGGRR